MRNESQTERMNTVVIGAGQAGLSVGYHLSQRGVPFVILDANERIGDQWRHRWDSLRLFTPARFAGLDGMTFPGAAELLPHQGRDGRLPRTLRANVQAAGAVRHARRTRLAPRRWVSRRRRRLDGSRPATSSWPWRTTSARACRRSRANSIRASCRSIRFDYRNPSQLRDGDVLIVGAGNSGAEIALEAARAHKTWMSGRDVGHVPFRRRRSCRAAHPVPPRAARAVSPHPDDRNTRSAAPCARRCCTSADRSCEPSRRTSTPPASSASRAWPAFATALPVLDDGRVLDVTNVVWCTGFHPGFSWLDLPGLRSRWRPAARAWHRDEPSGPRTSSGCTFSTRSRRR